MAGKNSFNSLAKEFFTKHPRLTKVIRFFLWTVMLCCILFAIVYVIVYSSIPSRSELRYVQNHTSSEIYSADSVLLGKYFIQDRTNITYEDIAPSVIHALIATEDARFFKHKGVDTRGMLRVMVKSILLGDESSGGGSTISQQLAKNIFPRKKYWIFSLPINKLREIILAGKIENEFTKEEILTLYLNTVPFGENAYGISSASKRFFNRPADSLKTEEAATLIGMLKGTSVYNPKRNPEKSKTRRNVVLSQMEKYNYLKSAVADSLKNTPLTLHYNYSTHSEGLATYFREHLRIELQNFLQDYKKEDGSSYNLYTDGLKIYTSLDSRMQQYAEEAVAQHMSQLQKSFDAHWGKKNPWGKNAEVVEMAKRRSDRYIALKEQGLSEEEIDKIFGTPVKMKVFTYKGGIEKIMSPIDSIKYYLRYLRPGFMAMETKSGYIRAWVGGIDMKYFKYDHVNINTKRQVGSTFKPIVYAAALQQGANPCEYIPNEQLVYEEYDNWSPRNSDNEYGGMYSMQGALTNSVNTVSAQLIIKAGIPNVMSLAKQMGIQSKLDPVPSLALGTADVSLYEMVSAFSVFANRGDYIAPRYLLKITDTQGKVIKDFTDRRKKQRVLSPTNSDIMVSMLQNVVNHGTAARLRYTYNIEGDVAGKTGTTQSHADGWFIGFTPDLVAGAWVGAEDRRIHFRSIDLGQGAAMALPVWGIFMNKVYKDPSYKKLKNEKFRVNTEDVALQLTCEDFIPPDTTDIFDEWWPFSKAERKERKQDKEEREESSDKAVADSGRGLKKLKDLFRRKKN
ncbi:MAG: transglycosylase domain-containing protein [Cytophagaceae bacterium]|nr:transglycosylase domain-containing protein [Cytophagaceae bacterium]